MLEDKLGGSPHDEHAATVPAAVAEPAAPMATAYQPIGAGKQPTKGETSFSNNRPPTASTYHGARPKTAKDDDDDDDNARPSSHRSSLDLPYIAE